MEHPPADFWSPSAAPWFTPLLGEGIVGTQTMFPGLGPTAPEHALVLGKRPGQAGNPWFSDLYVADQVHALRTAGFCLSDIDYASSASNDSQSADGRQRAWRESDRGAWSVAAWYQPQRNRVLKGLSLYARDRRRSEYRAVDDSLLNIGVERRVASSEGTSGALGLAAMFAGPRAGFVRVAADFSGRFDQSVDWYQPATSDYTESYAGLKNNGLRLDVSVGYLRVNESRGRSLLANAGIQGGGMRCFSQSRNDGPWQSLDTTDTQIDTLGGYLEVAASRRVSAGPWELFYGVAGYWYTAFDYDIEAEYDLWIEQYRTDRRTDRGKAVLPLLVRLRLGEHGHLFCSWQPSFTYSRSRQLSGPGRTVAREEAGAHLAEGALGVCWAPVQRVRFTLAPSFSDGVLMSGVECSLVW